MKAEVCSHCDCCDEDENCSRYGKPIAKVKSCGLAASHKFNRPFNCKGVWENIKWRETHSSPLHMEKETRK